MNILLVYPKYPDTFWSFKHAMRFISKKAAVPPLGLITVSALLPKNWNKKVVDMNVSVLDIVDILWADFVFISAMYVQKDSVNEVIKKCINSNVKIIAGGPLFTQEYKSYPEIDHFVLNEAEITLLPFIKDIKSGSNLKRIYKTDEYAGLHLCPVPDYHLLDMKAYVFMNLQVSRGCPFACDFCEITALLGRKVRMKTTAQVLLEMETLFNLNWRGPVAVVDDNFIGNKKEVKNVLLPAIKNWMQKRNYPFVLNAQASINLSDDEELMTLMNKTGFNSVFIGIETPEEESLKSCNKTQNGNRNLLKSVKKIQQFGLQVSGGFIVGFDTDISNIFQRQIDFIQKSGIVSAMVGLLNAPKNTKLYEQLEAENRITTEATGSNTDYSMNFVPKMNKTELIDGYKKIINDIYSIKPYYKRIRKLLLNYKSFNKTKPINSAQLKSFAKSFFVIGILNKGRFEYWKLLIWTLLQRPKLITHAITLAVFGYHYRIVYGLKK